MAGRRGLVDGLAQGLALLASGGGAASADETPVGVHGYVPEDAGQADRAVTAAPSCEDDGGVSQASAERIEALVAPFRDDLGLDAVIET